MTLAGLAGWDALLLLAACLLVVVAVAGVFARGGSPFGVFDRGGGALTSASSSSSRKFSP